MKAWSSLPKFTIMPKTPEKIQESCFFQGSQQCRKKTQRKTNKLQNPQEKHKKRIMLLLPTNFTTMPPNNLNKIHWEEKTPRKTSCKNHRRKTRRKLNPFPRFTTMQKQTLPKRNKTKALKTTKSGRKKKEASIQILWRLSLPSRFSSCWSSS